MSYLEQFLWVIYPYIMLTMFFVVNIYRYNRYQIDWSAKSSQFLETKQLKWGSILFHIGIILAFGGHFIGLIVPVGATEKVGITEGLYHTTAVIIGGIAGILTLIGITILLIRRTSNKRIKITNNTADITVAVLLLIVIGVGLFNTIGYNTFIGNFNYRETLAPWLRGLLIFRPDPILMKNVPLSFQIHTLIAFAVIGLWPFTRLVHVLSIPILYPVRSFIIYRRLGR